MICLKISPPAKFRVKLASEPTDDVTVSLSKTTHGDEISLDETPLIFRATDWQQEETITVSGLDDKIDDDDVTWGITLSFSSADGLYNVLPAQMVSGSNQDDDTAGLLLSATTDLETTEDGVITTFTVKLSSEPLEEVTIGLSATTNSDEIGLGLTPLSFNSGNWNATETVTVTGVDDDVDDGDQAWTITLSPGSAGDPKYDELANQTVSGNNIDNDTAGLIISALTGSGTTEDAGTNQFTVKLASEPIDTVTVNLSKTVNGDEISLDTTLLTFNSGNWNVTETVTVTGLNDDVDDGDQAWTITLATSSNDDVYEALPNETVTGTNQDND